MEKGYIYLEEVKLVFTYARITILAWSFITLIGLLPLRVSELLALVPLMLATLLLDWWLRTLLRQMTDRLEAMIGQKDHAKDGTGPTDDEELIRRAIRSKSVNAAFGNKASFQDLWEGNVEALARTYPDELRGYDSSSADAALAQHLAFWTGCDCARMERLMLKSGPGAR